MDNSELEGRTLVDSEGNKIGKISSVYIDPDTQRPQWGLVHTGFFGGKSSFVPLVETQLDGDDLRVPYTKQLVTEAPNIEAEGELSVEEEATLARHYGLGYSTAESDTGVLQGRETSPQTGATRPDEAMTRSEEQMRVGVMRRPSELVRLRKTVVTEPVSETVPLQREELRVEREPITEQNVDAAGAGPEISEATHEVTLSEEEPVVEKRAVPVERISLEKDVVTEEREVTGEVRKEQVEVERQPQQ